MARGDLWKWNYNVVKVSASPLGPDLRARCRLQRGEGVSWNVDSVEALGIYLQADCSWTNCEYAAGGSWTDLTHGRLCSPT
jgi:hypothetical protein